MAKPTRLTGSEDERIWAILFAGFAAAGENVQNSADKADEAFTLLRKRTEYCPK